MNVVPLAGALLVLFFQPAQSYRILNDVRGQSSFRRLASSISPAYVECYADNGSLIQIEGDSHAGHGAVEFLFFLFSGLVIGALVLSIHTKILARIPYLIKVFILGTVLGTMDLLVFDRRLDFVTKIDPEILKFAFIPILAFSDAMKLDSHVFTHVFWQTTLLAVPAVVAIVFGMAAVARYLLPFGWSWNSCLLFGSALGALDPVTMASVLINHSGLSSHMTVVLQSEAHIGSIVSLLLFELFVFINRGGDNHAVVATDTVGGDNHAAAAATRSWASLESNATNSLGQPVPSVSNEEIFVKLLELSGYGALVGFAFGLIGFVTLRANSQTTSNRAIIIQFVVTLLMAYGGFVVAEGILFANGLATVFITALVVAVKGWRVFAAVKTMANVWSFFQYVGNTVVFLASGLIIVELGYDVLSADPDELGLKILYLFVSYAFIMLIRVVYIALSFPLARHMGYGLSRKDAILLSASGVRGTISLILAIFLYKEIKTQDAGSVTIQIMGVVILTILVNGSLAHPLAAGLGLLRRSKVKQTLLKYVERRFTNTAREAFELVMQSEQFEDANEPLIKRHVTSLSLASDSSRHILRKKKQRLMGVRRLLRGWVPQNVKHEDPKDRRNTRNANSSLNLFEGEDGAEAKDDMEHDIEEVQGSQNIPKVPSSFLSVSVNEPNAVHKDDNQMILEVRELLLSALRSSYWDDIQEGIVPRGSGIASMLLSSVENGVDHANLGLVDFDRLFLEPVKGWNGASHINKFRVRDAVFRLPIFKWFAKESKRHRLGMSVYAVSCFIDAHERSRRLLDEYIGGAGEYRDHSALSRAPEVQRVLNESIEEERGAKEYLEAVRVQHPGLVRATESRKVISLILFQQKQFADDLKRKGLLDTATHHGLMLQIRHDMNLMNKLTIPGTQEELDEILVDAQDQVLQMEAEDSSVHGYPAAETLTSNKASRVKGRPSFNAGAVLRTDSDADSLQRSLSDPRRRSVQRGGSFSSSGMRGASFASNDGSSVFEMRSRLSSRLSRDLDKELFRFAATDDLYPDGDPPLLGQFSMPQAGNAPRRPSATIRRSSTTPGSFPSDENVLSVTVPARSRTQSDARTSPKSKAAVSPGARASIILAQSDPTLNDSSARRLAILRLLQDAQEKRELARMSILYRKLGNMYLEAGEYSDAHEAYGLSLNHANRYGEAKAYSLISRTYVAQAESLAKAENATGQTSHHPGELAGLYRLALQAARQGTTILSNAQSFNVQDTQGETREQCRKFLLKLEALEEKIVRVLRSLTLSIESEKFFWGN